MSELQFNVQIETNGRYHGEVFQDGNQWGYRIVETSAWSKHQDPTFEEFEPTRRFSAAWKAVDECIEEIEARLEADSKVVERNPIPDPGDEAFESAAKKVMGL